MQRWVTLTLAFEDSAQWTRPPKFGVLLIQPSSLLLTLGQPPSSADTTHSPSLPGMLITQHTVTSPTLPPGLQPSIPHPIVRGCSLESNSEGYHFRASNPFTSSPWPTPHPALQTVYPSYFPVPLCPLWCSQTGLLTIWCTHSVVSHLHVTAVRSLCPHRLLLQSVKSTSLLYGYSPSLIWPPQWAKSCTT